MALASVDNLKDIIRTWRGRITIGAGSNDTLTLTEAENALDRAEAELAVEYNVIPDDFTGYGKTNFITLECLTVFLSLMSSAGNDNANLDALRANIDRLKKALKAKSTGVLVTPDTVITADWYLENN